MQCIVTTNPIFMHTTHALLNKKLLAKKKIENVRFQKHLFYQSGKGFFNSEVLKDRHHYIHGNP
jgi:hypothetical protein